MKFTCTANLEDFAAARALNLRQTFLGSVIYFSTYWLPIFCAPFGIVLCSRMGLFLTGWSFGAAYVFGLIVCTPIALLMPKVDRSKRLRKMFDKQIPPDMRTTWYEISDEGITTAVVGTEAETIHWDKIVGTAQNNKMTLLYLGNKGFFFFPAASFTAEQRVELNELIIRHVKTRS